MILKLTSGQQLRLKIHFFFFLFPFFFLPLIWDDRCFIVSANTKRPKGCNSTPRGCLGDLSEREMEAHLWLDEDEDNHTHITHYSPIVYHCFINKKRLWICNESLKYRKEHTWWPVFAAAGSERQIKRTPHAEIYFTFLVNSLVTRYTTYLLSLKTKGCI